MGESFGIIACPLFEDEIIHELESDPTVSRVAVIENPFSENLMEKAKERSNKEWAMIIEDDLQDIDHSEDVVIWMKDIGLHVCPEELRDEVISTLDRMDPLCSTILMFYGLCGNALKDFDSICERYSSVVFVLRDEKEGRIADDCVAAVIGGASNYLQLMKEQTGVMYVTPGWADNWKSLTANSRMLEGVDMDHKEFTRMLFDMAGYEKVLKICTGLQDEGRFEERTREFAEEYGFRIEEMEGNLDVVDHTYRTARQRHLADAKGKALSN